MEETPMKLSEQGLIVYKAMLDRMDFLKKQQWTITNYLVLIYAAIFWFGTDLRLSASEKCLLATLVVVAGICGISLLVLIQYDLSQARERIEKTDDTVFGAEERSALGIERYRGPHLRGISFLTALIGVAAFGAILLIWSLLRSAGG